jgi:hypothetical protein
MHICNKHKFDVVYSHNILQHPQLDYERCAESDILGKEYKLAVGSDRDCNKGRSVPCQDKQGVPKVDAVHTVSMRNRVLERNKQGVLTLRWV